MDQHHNFADAEPAVTPTAKRGRVFDLAQQQSRIETLRRAQANAELPTMSAAEMSAFRDAALRSFDPVA